MCVFRTGSVVIDFIDERFPLEFSLCTPSAGGLLSSSFPVITRLGGWLGRQMQACLYLISVARVIQCCMMHAASMP